MNNLQELFAEWACMKAIEENAIENRRRIEDELSVALGIATTPTKSNTFREGQYVVNVKRNITEKIDQPLLQRVAEHHGIESYLGELFNWKPTKKAAEWKQAPKDITNILALALTESEGRPSYTITKKEVF